MTKSAKKTQLVFNFDTTGSMRPCIAQVQRTVEGVLAPLLKEIPNLEIGIGANGDYCDARTAYVTKRLGLTSDLHTLTQFIRGVGYTHGGDAPECYELVLREAQSYEWAVNANKILVLIADDVPHSANEPDNRLRLDWRVEARKLRDMGVVVYTVQCLSKNYATPFYRELAEITSGYHLTLDQFDEVTDLLMAIGYTQAGQEPLARFEASVERAGRMNRTLDNSFRILSGRKQSSRYQPVANGLKPVPPGRFQILQVDSTCDIRGFVEANGLIFKTGRGFYEFTKPETIQEGKQVVLRDKKTGDMYTGDGARHMIGLPPGMRGRIKPADLNRFDVFVQSTSYNRKLLDGTRFLYEVDLDR